MDKICLCQLCFHSRREYEIPAFPVTLLAFSDLASQMIIWGLRNSHFGLNRYRSIARYQTPIAWYLKILVSSPQAVEMRFLTTASPEYWHRPYKSEFPHCRAVTRAPGCWVRQNEDTWDMQLLLFFLHCRDGSGRWFTTPAPLQSTLTRQTRGIFSARFCPRLSRSIRGTGNPRPRKQA